MSGDSETFARASTGIPGLDYTLDGGLPVNRMYLVQGDPGAGKTTLAMQFLLAGVRRGEPALYATLSETGEELRDIAVSHGWQLDGVDICDLQSAQDGEVEKMNFPVDEIDHQGQIEQSLAVCDVLVVCRGSDHGVVRIHHAAGTGHPP